MKMKLQKPTCFRGGGKLTILLLLVFGVAAAAEAAMAIRIDSVTQRWPWNNKVDIAYTVEGGQELATSNFCKIVFSTVIGGNTYTIDSTTVGASANEGSHKVTWTLPSRRWRRPIRVRSSSGSTTGRESTSTCRRS